MPQSTPHGKTVLRVESRPYTLPFATPWRTSQGLFVVRRGWHVAVFCADGLRGLGDVAPWPGFGTDAQTCAAALETLQRTWMGMPWPCAAALAALLSQLPVEVAYGLSLACADIQAQQRGITLAAAWGPHPQAHVRVHALVENARQAQQAIAAGYDTLKVKVGIGPLADEVTRLVALRACIGPRIMLRLDANGAWPLEVAIRAARLLAMVSPEWLEQPVAASDVAGLRRVRQLGGVPIAADESVTNMASLAALIAAEAVDVIVLKPMFTGDIQTAITLGQHAQAAGLTVVVTHALESAIGRLGALHVAAALRCRVACGLGGSPLKPDIVAGPPVLNGAMALPVETTGLGLQALLWPFATAS